MCYLGWPKRKSGHKVSTSGRLGPEQIVILRWTMPQENVEIVRRNYEVVNSIGRTGPEFVDREDVAPDLSRAG
jgi:hypothetical protein